MLGERHERQVFRLRPRSAQNDITKLAFVVSHPSDKNKSVARVGHPLSSWYPRSPNARDLGHPCLCWVEVGTSWMGHPCLCWVSDTKGRFFDCGPRSAQNDITKLAFVVSHPSDKNKSVARVGHPLSSWYPRSPNARDLGHPCLCWVSDTKGRFFDCGPRSAQNDITKLAFVVSHPSDKNKSVARVGHPLSSWYPRSPNARDLGHPCLCWVEVGTSWMGHPCLCWVERGGWESGDRIERRRAAGFGSTLPSAVDHLQFDFFSEIV